MCTDVLSNKAVWASLLAKRTADFIGGTVEHCLFEQDIFRGTITSIEIVGDELVITAKGMECLHLVGGKMPAVRKWFRVAEQYGHLTYPFKVVDDSGIKGADRIVVPTAPRWLKPRDAGSDISFAHEFVRVTLRVNNNG